MHSLVQPILVKLIRFESNLYELGHAFESRLFPYVQTG